MRSVDQARPGGPQAKPSGEIGETGAAAILGGEVASVAGSIEAMLEMAGKDRSAQAMVLPNKTKEELVEEVSLDGLLWEATDDSEEEIGDGGRRGQAG